MVWGVLYGGTISAMNFPHAPKRLLPTIRPSCNGSNASIFFI